MSHPLGGCVSKLEIYSEKESLSERVLLAWFAKHEFSLPLFESSIGAQIQR